MNSNDENDINYYFHEVSLIGNYFFFAGFLHVHKVYLNYWHLQYSEFFNFITDFPSYLTLYDNPISKCFYKYLE